MSMEETLLSTAQAAERLGVTVRGVQKMIEEGRLKALKIGRDYVISPHALEGITRQPAGRPPKVKAEGSTVVEKPKRAAKKGGKK